MRGSLSMPPACSVLSFRLDHKVAPFEGYSGVVGDVRWTSVIPMVDGVPVPLPGMFDAVLAWNMHKEGRYDEPLFTCSCGVAECAGYHNSMGVVITNDTVEWIFPMEHPYLSRLSPLFGEGAPMAWVFDRGAYTQALVDLRRAILELEATQPEAPIVLDDGGRYADLPDPIALRMEAEDKQLQTYFQKRERDARMYGAWLRSEVHGTWGATHFEVLVPRLLDVAADIAMTQMEVVAEEMERSRREAWIAEASQSLTPDGILALASSIPFQELDEYGWMPQPEHKSAFARAWPEVNLRLVASA